jgi:acyl-CoA synthetase (AMP-forming)/AMP-acid ligase II
MNQDERSLPIAVQSVNFELTYDELGSDQLGLRGQVPQGGVAALSTDDAAVVAAALTSLDGWASEVRLIPPCVDVPADITDVATITPRMGGPTEDGESLPEATRWVLYTSGTTGAPKSISHTIQTLTRTVVAGKRGAFVWGLLYDPNRMAGIQVLLQGLRSEATVIAPPLSQPLGARVRTLVDAGVNALSATPSLWRQILQLPISHEWDLRQITLGGEIADQRVLDALANRFPSSRIVHVFASTETGAAFSVKDQRAGFPLDYLNDPPRGVRLEIRDDVLHVFSPGVSAAESDGFASTGDIVELIGDRIMFRGRSTGVVNVGGTNVWPEVVETILREHPDVIEAIVSAKPNPMMGNVLVAQVTLTDDADPTGVAKRLRRWVRDQAPGSHVPASVSVVDELEVSAAGKALR